VEVIEEHLDGLIGVTKNMFIELLHILFLNAVDDVLQANGRLCLLEIKLFLE
jgi:hypothetical protein